MSTLATTSRGEGLRRRAHRFIPGGAHTYAKGDDQYPEAYPAFIVRGSGCHVWDVDGNEYIEYGMGLRAVTLGHGFRPVVEAAATAMAMGTNFTRPAPIEAECAEELLEITRSGDMAKFTKDGSTATTAALRLARAYTGRDLVAVCHDHPFFSYDDWFIGTTEMDAGIPAGPKNLVLPFAYNDLAGLRRLFESHPGEIAAVIMEPEASVEPAPGYLEGVQRLCREEGSLLILDENITGFRWDIRGGQGYHGLSPDLSCWGKALANGFALSALTGRREVMELGGLHHSRERVFLLSTTHGAETHAMAAAIAAMRTYRENPVVETLHEQGRKLARQLDSVIRAHGLAEHIFLAGRPWNLTFACLDSAGQRSQALRSLFLQENARRGVIGPSFVVSFAHSDEDIERTVAAVEGTLAVYEAALEDGVDRYLIGEPSKVVFRRYN